MKCAPVLFLLACVLVVGALGCEVSRQNNSPGKQGSSDSASTSPSAGYVDAGAEVSFNVYLAKIRLFLNIRDVDVLVIKAINWASREIRYLFNGREETTLLTASQMQELQRDQKALTSQRSNGQ